MAARNVEKKPVNDHLIFKQLLIGLETGINDNGHKIMDKEWVIISVFYVHIHSEYVNIH